MPNNKEGGPNKIWSNKWKNPAVPGAKWREISVVIEDAKFIKQYFHSHMPLSFVFAVMMGKGWTMMFPKVPKQKKGGSDGEEKEGQAPDAPDGDA